MAALELKLFYLRTRVRKVSQRQMAADLSIRQATISQIERGERKPSFALLRELCRYFDIRADYLLDDELGVVPQDRDRWSVRDSLVSAGMWIEVPSDQIKRLPNGKSLCPVIPGETGYDDEAREVREREVAGEQAQEGQGAVQELSQRRASNEAELEVALASELRDFQKRRGRWRSAPSQDP